MESKDMDMKEYTDAKSAKETKNQGGRPGIVIAEAKGLMAESKGGDDFQGAYAKMGIDVNEGAGAGAGAHGNPWGNWGVECFQARIIQCHVENLPPGSRPGNSKIWDKCLQSSSGKTYMFVRTLRTAIHGKVRHAYLLEETAPGSGRYNFLQSEQRAIKEMGLASINSGQLAEDPKTEILVQDRLGIPGCNFVCGLHECTFDARNVYSVLPFCDGGELFDRVEESGALPEQQVKIYFKQIMQGMLYIHQKGICHRDMSLENVLLANSGAIARIIDFGLCLEMTPDANGQPLPFPPSGPVGKMFYMAPEIFMNQTPFHGHLADIWSCGIMLFIMLIGAPPYEQPDAADPRFVKVYQEGPSALLAAWGITNISPQACELLDMMLNAAQPLNRPDAQAVLQHPWMQ